MKKSKDFIRHYDNIMSPEICNAILDECKSLSFEALTRETPDGNYLTKERKCHGAPLPKQFENDTLHFDVHNMCNPHSEQFDAVFS